MASDKERQTYTWRFTLLMLMKVLLHFLHLNWPFSLTYCLGAKVGAMIWHMRCHLTAAMEGPESSLGAEVVNSSTLGPCKVSFSESLLSLPLPFCFLSFLFFFATGSGWLSSGQCCLLPNRFSNQWVSFWMGSGSSLILMLKWGRCRCWSGWGRCRYRGNWCWGDWCWDGCRRGRCGCRKDYRGRGQWKCLLHKAWDFFKLFPSRSAFLEGTRKIVSDGLLCLFLQPSFEGVFLLLSDFCYIFIGLLQLSGNLKTVRSGQ